MTPERWQKIEDLFQSARMRSAAERAAFLDGACAGDTELRAEVEALLRAEDSAGSFINTSAVKVAAGLIAADRAAEMEGRTIGHYEILSPLGAGGMGEVYLAADTRTRRRVALKLLPDYLGKDEQRAGRFRQEAHAVMMLNHPNIVTVYDIGQQEGTQFIASELVEGQTLRRRLVTASLEVGEALEIAAQVAGALAAAHAAGIVHRDIKPENIMLRPDGYVKVLDFGIAKLAEQRPATVDTEAATRALVATGPGVVMGTAHYMSPEQARGLTVNERTDIWSLGVVLFEMIAGRVPFEGATPSDVMASVLEKQLPPLARFAPDAPSQVQWILTKALRKNSDERYQTVKEMLTDLRELKQEMNAQAHLERSTAPGIERGTAGSTSASGVPIGGLPDVHTTSSAEYIVGELKRHKTGTLVAVAVLILAVVGGGFALYRVLSRNKSEAPHSPNFVALTTGGKAADQIIDGEVTISPDGKYVTYAAFDDKQQQALWVKQVATNSQVQIVPPVVGAFFGTTFSPDGEFIYYVRTDRSNALIPALYRVPVIGGTSVKVLDNVWNTVGFSPDGKRFAFVRRQPSQRENSLMVANTDGNSEPTTLASVKAPVYFPDETAPSWSPDGRTIAIATVTRTGTIDATIVGVSAANGKIAPLTSEKWPDMGRVLWLPDGSGLIFTASPGLNQPRTQVYFLPYPEGKARRITNDLNGYGGISLGVTADSKTIATLLTRESADVWVTAPNDDESHAREITHGGTWEGSFGLSWTPDGRIVYSTRAGDNFDISIMNADGSSRRQLTADAYWEDGPRVSPDGRYIVFQSERAGNLNIWRIDADGNNPKQLTEGNGVDQHFTFSPDSQWVVFDSTRAGKQAIWKVNINGGPPAQLAESPSWYPAVSPDGKLLAYGHLDEVGGSQPRPQLIIIPFAGGPAVKTIDVSATVNPDRGSFQWTPDGRAICFVDERTNVPNVWAQPIDGGPPKQLTNFKSQFIHRYAFSRDGKQIALSRGIQTSDIVLIKDFR